MNRKTYQITLIGMIIVAIGLITANAIYLKINGKVLLDWIWIFVIIMVGYVYIRYRLNGPLQMFSTKFNMLVDYDLDVEAAEALAEQAAGDAPTANIKALYSLYLGMAKYYNAKYEEAIKIMHMLDLRKLNQVYHILVFAFSAYSAYEIGDTEEFTLNIDRIKGVVPRLNPRYRPFGNSYVELLEAMANADVALDQYKDMIEKHFSHPDGYISTKLVFHYRMADYYERLGDTLEMDKNLAFVIANGKNHHTAVQARRKFKNSVNVDDYIIVEETPSEAEPEVIEGDFHQIEEPSIDSIEANDADEENKE